MWPKWCAEKLRQMPYCSEPAIASAIQLVFLSTANELSCEPKLSNGYNSKQIDLLDLCHQQMSNSSSCRSYSSLYVQMSPDIRVNQQHIALVAIDVVRLRRGRLAG
jgi:hypothetical protein